MDSISFKSKICPVSYSEFLSRTSRFGRKSFVAYPWTVKESIFRSGNAYTSGVIDCTVCGIGDGDKILLMHICPDVEENKDFNKIKEFVLSKTKMMNKNYLQGFLLGSQGSLCTKSRKLFENFADLLENMKIPFSKFRAGYSETDVAYDTIHDEWLISSEDVYELSKNRNPQKVLEDMFERIDIAECDELV